MNATKPSHKLGFFRDVHGFLSDDERREIQYLSMNSGFGRYRGSVLQIGAFHGLSTLVILSALRPGRRLTVIDTNRYPEFFANLKKYGVSRRVKFFHGDFRTLDFSGKSFDFVLVDNCHTYKNTVDVFRAVRKFIVRYGKIVFRDCNQTEESEIDKAILKIVEVYPSFEAERDGYLKTIELIDPDKKPPLETVQAHIIAAKSDEKWESRLLE